MKDYKECPIRDYVRIIQLLDNPLDTLTDEELWVLYTKAKEDRAETYKRKFENELVNRRVITTSQTSIFD